MTSFTKWLVAVPFIFLIAFAVPRVIAGKWLWFSGRFYETFFVFLTAGMWLGATAFVDVKRPRGPRDATDNLIAFCLIAVVPVAVFDRVHGIAATMPEVISIFGIAVAVGAVFIGLSARLTLGRSYLPRAAALSGGQLVRTGPYRWIRHPLYSAAILWVTGWPLIIASFCAAIVGLVFLLPALFRRMAVEEAGLRQEYGLAYDEYRATTKRLIPFLY